MGTLMFLGGCKMVHQFWKAVCISSKRPLWSHLSLTKVFNLGAVDMWDQAILWESVLWDG